MRKASRKRAAAVAAAATVVAFPAAAHADTFGGGNADEGYPADDGLHSYCWGPGFHPTYHQHALEAMNNLHNNTDMSTVFLGACDDWTNAVWYTNDLPGLYGSYQCQAWVWLSNRCRNAHTTMNPYLLNPMSINQKHKTACHEAGHSVGLRHGTVGPDYEDCMRSGNYERYRYGQHHKDHINGTY